MDVSPGLPRPGFASTDRPVPFIQRMMTLRMLQSLLLHTTVETDHSPAAHRRLTSRSVGLFASQTKKQRRVRTPPCVLDYDA